jgi:hypothetical protein
MRPARVARFKRGHQALLELLINPPQLISPRDAISRQAEANQNEHQD